MKLLFWDITRSKKAVPVTTPLEDMQAAVDNLNLCWAELRAVAPHIGPWIEWADKEVCLVETTRKKSKLNA